MVTIEGKNPVIEALEGQRKIKKIYLQQNIHGEKIKYIKKLVQLDGIMLKRVSKQELDKIVGDRNHQGVVAIGQKNQLYDIEVILQRAQKQREAPLLVILDEIQDPHNMGAIIRTACAAGAHGLIFARNRQVGITSTVIKVAAGATEHLPLVRVANINYALKKIKQAGVWVVGAEIENATVYYEKKFKGPLALVIGNEGRGLRRLVKKNCDFLVKIPMKKMNSLNASVATGILLFEIIRQRQN